MLLREKMFIVNFLKSRLYWGIIESRFTPDWHKGYNLNSVNLYNVGVMQNINTDGKSYFIVTAINQGGALGNSFLPNFYSQVDSLSFIVNKSIVV